MKNKKIFIMSIIFIIFLIICFTIIYYNKNNKVCLQGTNIPIDDINNAINKYTTPYSFLKKNKDNTYSYFIFSVPIFKKYKQNDYSLIQNYRNISIPEKIEKTTPIEITNEYTNIKQFFKNKLIKKSSISRNIFNDKINGTQYMNNNEKIIIYPTYLGANYEINNKLHESNFFIEIQDCNYYIKNDNHIIFYNDNHLIISILYFSSINKNNNINYDNINLSINNYNKTFHINIQFPYNSTLFLSLNSYENKQPDSCVYSEKNNSNFYLKDVSIIGNHDSYGQGINYLRFRINNFIKTFSTEIISARYNSKVLDSSKKNFISMYRINDIWNSSQITWLNKPNSKDIVSNGEIKNNFIIFNITNFIKECVNDKNGTIESHGVQLKNKKEDDNYSILASSDNGFYIPYVEIILKNKPFIFRDTENINN